jgi:hypothetical protein
MRSSLIFTFQIFSPSKVIFAGVGVLLLVRILLYPFTRAIVTYSQAAMDVRASQGTLNDIFERMENFFRRLEIYTEASPTPKMIDIAVKIMVEVLSILAIATKEIKQGRTSEYIRYKCVTIDRKCSGKYLKKLVGKTDLADALTNEEARMATAQILKATHAVDERVAGVHDKVDQVKRS